jgi:hypothetical protein
MGMYMVGSAQAFIKSMLITLPQTTDILSYFMLREVNLFSPVVHALTFPLSYFSSTDKFMNPEYLLQILVPAFQTIFSVCLFSHFDFLRFEYSQAM